MDPNAALNELRRLARRAPLDVENNSDALRMAELFRGLDVWISKGGFLPEEWQKNRPV